MADQPFLPFEEEETLASSSPSPPRAAGARPAPEPEPEPLATGTLEPSLPSLPSLPAFLPADASLVSGPKTSGVPAPTPAGDFPGGPIERQSPPARKRSPPARKKTPAPGDSEAAADPSASARPLLLESLARICVRHPLEEKVLVSPSLLVGHQIAEALARSGVTVVHLRVETTRTLAHALVGPELAREGRRLLSRAQALALVEQACSDELTEGSYFGALRDRPGFHRAIQSTFDELRAAGLAPGGLPVQAFADERKPRELRRILEAYEAALERGGWVDRAEVLRRAADLARPAPDAPLLLLPDSLDLSAVERRFLEGQGPDRLVPLAADAASDWTSPASAARIFRASGEENEIRAVFREVLSRGLPLDRVEVLHTDASTYPPLAFELSSEHGIPATFSGGVSATFTRPGQAALAFLRWIGRRFEAEALREALSSGLIAFPQGMSSRIGPLVAAQEMRRAVIGWGRDRHLAALDRLAAEIAFPRPLRADDDSQARKSRREKRLGALGAARTFVSRALSLAPETGESDLPSLARGARTFVAEFARVAGELDATAAAALARLFSELELLPGRPAPIDQTVARLVDAVQALQVTPDRPRPGKIHFAEFRTGGFSGRPHTFVIGLDERRHPGGGHEDPVLTDDERQRINALSSTSLVLAPDRSRESAAALRTVVARLRGEVVFGYSGWNLRDLANPGEVFPSPFLLEAFRLRGGESDADYARLAASVGEGVGFVPGSARALDETEWWLSSIGDARGPDTCGVVERMHPWLADGRRAEDARNSLEQTPWDGVFSSPTPELDPRLNGIPMSSSRIQALAECPFGYFLAHVLRLASPDEPAENGAEWLDPSSAGTLIHRVFRRFLEDLSTAGRRPAYPDDLGAILAVGDAELTSMRSRFPPRSELAFDRTRDNVRFASRTFLISEAARAADVEPVAFEVSFGVDSEERAAAYPDPVEIALPGGRSFRLRGSIDRIDRDRDGRFHVWDYKTGSSAFTYEQRGIAAGRQIQPALYALAWQALLARDGKPGTVEQSGYFFPGRRGLGERFTVRFTEAEAAETLDTLFDLLASGAFLHSPDEDSDCFTCRELSVFCGDRKTSGRRSHSKLAGAQQRSLAAWRKLREDE